MQSLEDAFPKARMDRSDGLKLILDGAWIHVRASNTEPVLRIAAEARTDEKVDALYNQALGLLRG